MPQIQEIEGENLPTNLVDSFSTTSSSSNSSPFNSPHNEEVSPQDIFYTATSRTSLLSNQLHSTSDKINKFSFPQIFDQPSSFQNFYQSSETLPLESYIPSSNFFLHLQPSPCSSCGIDSTSISLDPLSSTNQNFVQLLPCKHLLCPTCLNTLINSTSNDPARPCNCFACSTVEVIDFNAVQFLPVEEEEKEEEKEKEKENLIEWKTPTKKKDKGRMNLGRLENRLLGELSPIRNLVWSDEPLTTSSGSSTSTTNSTPLTSPGSARSFSTLTENEIARSQEWSVVRVDNVSSFFPLFQINIVLNLFIFHFLDTLGSSN